jgi:2-haloacid dehalogenase
MKLADFKVLTFDCYGTLIDWETGILAGLAPLVAKSRGTLSREQILGSFARHESAQEEETPAMPYSQLLAAVYMRLAGSWGTAASQHEADTFGGSVPQ